jgi:hypothetical protein
MHVGDTTVHRHVCRHGNTWPVQSTFLPHGKARAASATKPLVTNVVADLGQVTVCLERFLLDRTV